MTGSGQDQEQAAAGNASGEEETPPAAGTPAWWEWREPAWRKWLNRFCENWIFALIIAMGIRHFALEAYRIPTSSMEPMLYGDYALTKADHVIVDKFLFRFTGPDRWDVTVFQYPIPEVEGPQGPAAPRVAWNGRGERIDNMFTKPLLHRNFVKRCVALPGDVFYISGGNIYLQQPDGSFSCAQKPDDLVERLWQTVYKMGAQPEYEQHAHYRPWKGATRVTDEGLLRLDLSESAPEATFTQPLRNVYVRPSEGEVIVARRPASPGQAVPISMVEPLFTYKDNSKGSLWDLNDWNIARFTTADKPNAGKGKEFNVHMDEWVGDLAFRFAVVESTADLRLELRHGTVASYALTLTEGGWSLSGPTGVLAEGSEGKLSSWALVRLDDRLWVERDGVVLRERIEVPAVDANEHHSSFAFCGTGTHQIGNVQVDRDVHYCRNGILEDEHAAWSEIRKQVSSVDPGQAMQYGAGIGLAKAQLITMQRNRGAFIPHLVDEQLSQRLLSDLERTAQGKRGFEDWLQPIGISPETAIRVPEGAYLLLGDNSPFSLDSRNWGWVPETNLRGRVLYSVMLPFKRWQTVR